MEIQTDSGIDLNSTYAEIRQRIVAHCDDSQDQKLRKLLGQQILGDQKPSVGLRKLQQLVQGNENLIRLPFLEMLPAQVQVVLTTLSTATIEGLAEAADKMIEQLQLSSAKSVKAISPEDQPAIPCIH